MFPIKVNNHPPPKLKTFRFFLMSALIVSIPINTLTNTHAKTLQEIQQQITTLEQQIILTENEVYKLDNDIINSMENLNKIQEDMRQSETLLKDIKEQVLATKDDYLEAINLAGDRLRSIQRREQNQTLQFLAILLDSSSFPDFIQRAQAVKMIFENDKRILESLAEKEDRYKQIQQVELSAHNKLVILEREFLTEERLLKTKKENARLKITELETMLSELKEDEQSEINRIEEEKRRQEEERLEQLKIQQELLRQFNQQNNTNNNNGNTVGGDQQSTEQNNRAMSSGNYITTPVNIDFYKYPLTDYNPQKAEQIINTAYKYLGVPYVWGGTTPNGFDCSGFVQYVYRENGINLPRVTQQQQHIGKQIPLTELKPGDLIHRNNPSTHIGIYLGDGLYVHAPFTGTVVRIEDYNPNRWTSATRVF